MTSPIDLHTHRAPDSRDILYSAGLHPWLTSEATPEMIAAIDARARRADVVAIGEVGLDALRGAPPARQEEIFRHYVDLSEELRKPLIIHCVKAWDALMRIRRERRPQQPWAIHGFRGKQELARQLLDAGMYLSLGPRHNPSAAAIIPTDRLLIETDDDPAADLASLAASLAAYDPAATLRFLNLPADTPLRAVVNLPG